MIVEHCPYCGCVIDKLSEDHIFSNFLGGKKKIPSCAQCNHDFGARFEGKAAEELKKLRGILSLIGVNRPWPCRFRWRYAYSEDGVLSDFVFEGDQILVVPSRPTVVRNEEGRIARVRVRSEAEAKQHINAVLRKNPRMTFEVKVHKTKREFRWPPLRVNTGINLGLLALKMCVAQLTLFDNFNRDEVALALRNLNRPPLIRLRCCFKDARVHDAIGVHPPLSHTIFVERNSTRLYGIVGFFGVVQIYCDLGKPTGTTNASACLGVLDWLGQKEEFRQVYPLALDPPEEYVPFSEIMRISDSVQSRLVQEAKRAGATGEATAWLETSPAWSSATLSHQGTVEYLLRAPKL